MSLGGQAALADWLAWSEELYVTPNTDTKMTKKELIAALEQFGDDEVIVCADENGCWDNIDEVKRIGGRPKGTPAIVWGGGSPFSDE